jgi:predicted ATP-dependent serine protease
MNNINPKILPKDIQDTPIENANAEHGAHTQYTPPNSEHSVILRLPETSEQSERCEQTKYFYRPKLVSELIEVDFPEPRHIVPGLIVPGLTILGGPPKVGKSWFVLEMLLSVCTGSQFLDRQSCEKTPVLYIALEDSPRRLQTRIKKITFSRAFEEKRGLSELHYETEWPSFDTHGISQLTSYITEHKVQVIVFDTIKKVQRTRKGRDNYGEDYRDFGELQRLAVDHGVSIICVTHTTKFKNGDPFDDISGTRGVSGAADTLIVLTKDSDFFTLRVKGRDIPDLEMCLDFDEESGCYKYIDEPLTVGMSDQRKSILTCLQESDQALRPKEISARTGISYDVVRKLCPKMKSTGQIESLNGRYKAKVIHTVPSVPSISSVQSSNSEIEG